MLGVAFGDVGDGVVGGPGVVDDGTGWGLGGAAGARRMDGLTLHAGGAQQCIVGHVDDGTGDDLLGGGCPLVGGDVDGLVIRGGDFFELVVGVVGVGRKKWDQTPNPAPLLAFQPIQHCPHAPCRRFHRRKISRLNPLVRHHPRATNTRHIGER